MIPYYEELNDEEKNTVTKVIRTLLKQTFVLERKYDKKSGRLVYNKEFRTIDLHQEFLREYFKIKRKSASGSLLYRRRNFDRREDFQIINHLSSDLKIIIR